MQRIILLFVVSCISDMAIALRNAYPSCRTTDTCIRLTECQPYMNLIRSLKRPLSSAAVTFLRRQECGFDGSFPMVCCFPTGAVNSEHKRSKLITKEDQPKQPHPWYPTKTEERDFSNKQPNKPDFAPSDVSDYRLFKFPVPQKEDSHISTLRSTTTTEKATSTTRLSRRRAVEVWNLYDSIKLSTQQPKKDDKNKREEDLKRKMEALNDAFAYTAMDDFFVRRMLGSNR